MLYQTLNYQKTGNVSIINIIGPVGGQVELTQLADELIEICKETVWDEELRVIVLTGVEIGSIGIISRTDEEQQKKIFLVLNRSPNLINQ